MRFFRSISIIFFALFAAVHLSAATPIPFQYRDGMIWLKIAVAGKKEPLNFLLDSGAGTSVLDLAAARQLGLKLDQPESVQGVSGHALAYHVRGFRACVGDVPIATSLLAVDLRGPSRCCHQRIDGLLGVNFFLEHIVQIDYAAQRIRLLQPNEENPSGGEVLPLTKCNDTFCTRISVARNSPELLRVDTGCCTTLEWVVTGDKTKKLRSSTIGLNSGPGEGIRADVQLGKTLVPAVKTGIHSAQMFSGESGLIGNGLLSRFTITIDAARQRLLLASRLE